MHLCVVRPCIGSGFDVICYVHTGQSCVAALGYDSYSAYLLAASRFARSAYRVLHGVTWCCICNGIPPCFFTYPSPAYDAWWRSNVCFSAGPFVNQCPAPCCNNIGVPAACSLCPAVISRAVPVAVALAYFWKQISGKNDVEEDDVNRELGDQVCFGRKGRRPCMLDGSLVYL